MKKINQILLFVLTMNMSFAQQTPLFSWANQFTGPTIDGATGIAIDASGNIFTAGFFGATVDFDPGPGTYTLTTGGNDAFVCKQNNNGGFIWVKSFQGTFNNFVQITDIKLDAMGNIYVSGQFDNTADFDPSAAVYTLTSNGQKDIFIVKLNSLGNLLWVKQIGNIYGDYGGSIAVDPSGNVFISSFFYGSMDFDPGPGFYTVSTFSAMVRDSYVLKLDGNGNIVWLEQIGGSDNTVCSEIEIDQNSNIYISGNFEGVTDFDPGASTYTLSAMGTYDGCVLKLNSSGNFLWAKQFGAAGTSCLPSFIALDATGDAYISGTFQGAIDFDPGPATYTVQNGPADIFVTKINTAGNFVWVKGFGGGGGASNSISLDGSGNIYFTGRFNGTADFDPGPSVLSYSSQGMTDGFLCKLDPSGNLNWARVFGQFNNDGGSAVVVDPTNNVYLAGYFSGVVDFDFTPATYTLTGSSDIFVEKMGQCTIPNPPVNITPAGDLLICGPATTTLIATGSGTISWFGIPVGGGAIGSGTSIATVTLPLGQYTYYAEAATCTTSPARTPITVTVVSCAGINSVNNEDEFVKVYPNPSNGIFTVDLQHPAVVTVSNLIGKIIVQEKLLEKKQIIDLREFNDRLYILKIEGGGTTKIIKLMKE